MVSERMLGLGTARSVIRELFEYGKQRAAVVGAENIYDFSLGNPSVPAPDAVNETAIRILRETGKLEHLPGKLQQAAIAREENPAASLTELAEMMEPPITKPAMNHRLKKLVLASKEG